MKRLAILAALVLAGCGGSSPTSPTPPPPSTPTLYSLTGRVSSAAGGGITGASVLIADGPNAGKSQSTNSAGDYAFQGLAASGFTLSVSAAGFVPKAGPISLSQNVTANVTLLPAALYGRTGTGDTVFDLPTYIARIRIQADYGAFSSNFIVHIAGRSVVNELMGTAWSQTHFDGTYVTSGGTVEILSSSGVAWSFAEVR